MIGRLLAPVHALITRALWLLGVVLGETTVAYLLRGFAQARRHTAHLRLFAQHLHSPLLQGRTILVTGTARGLGKGIAAHLLAARARLIIPLRKGPGDVNALRVRLADHATAVIMQFAEDPSKVSPLSAEDVNIVCPTCGLELGSLASIDRFVDVLSAQGIVVDAVINNAGMVPISQGVTADGFERAFGINFLGTAHLTRRLQESGVLHPTASRIINVSSEEHRLASLAPHMPAVASGRGGVPLGTLPSHATVFNALERYAYSKLLLTCFSHELRRRSSGHVVVFDVCPGPVGSEIAREAPWPLGAFTQLGMRLAFPSPTEAALPVLTLAVAPLEALPDASAVHYHMCEPLAPGQGAADEAVGNWLWVEMEKLLEARRPPEGQ